MKYFCFVALPVLVLASNCSEKKESESVSLIWNENKATGVSISSKMIREASMDSLESFLQIKLANATEDRSILGTLVREDDRVVFTPVVPFTRGYTYQIHFRGHVIDAFEIPFREDDQSPRLLSIYPTQDTVPENLLKLYLRFSAPMAEGRSLTFVTVLRNNGDTVKGTFLDLQPELWNEDGTLLTLWLDPGRIKRDLIPNKELGNPLTKGEQYVIHISANWKGKNGRLLEEGYSKSFYVSDRDEQSADVTKWKVSSPQSLTKEKLKIEFEEPLDYSLIMNALQVINDQEKLVNGSFQPGKEEKIIYFIPSEDWKTGEYVLRVESRLEDLAGNNLNRLFDRDVAVPESKSDQILYTVKFNVR